MPMTCLTVVMNWLRQWFKVEKQLGKAYQQLLESNAEAILDGNDVTTLLPEPIVKRKFFSKF